MLKSENSFCLRYSHNNNVYKDIRQHYVFYSLAALCSIRVVVFFFFIDVNCPQAAVMRGYKLQQLPEKRIDIVLAPMHLFWIKSICSSSGNWHPWKLAQLGQSTLKILMLEVVYRIWKFFVILFGPCKLNYWRCWLEVEGMKKVGSWRLFMMGHQNLAKIWFFFFFFFFFINWEFN